MKTTLAIIGILLAAAFCCATALAQTKPAPVPAPPVATQPVGDADALQTLLATGKTPPAKSVYVLDKTVQLNGVALNLSNVTIRASTTAPVNMALLGLVNCSGTISGNTIDGQRKARGNDPAVNGTLVVLLGCHDLSVSGNSLQNSPADCLRIAAINPQDATTACQRVTVSGNKFSNTWRNLISIIGGQGIAVRGNSFTNAINGQVPNAAVDIEPNGRQVDAAGQVIYPGDAQGICTAITLSGNMVTNCLRGFASPNTGCGTTCVYYTGNTIRNCTYGIISESNLSLINGNDVAGGSIYAENSDQQTITGNLAQTIYCDVTRVLNPVGHVIMFNTAPGGISLHYCYGHFTQSGNLGTINN